MRFIWSIAIVIWCLLLAFLGFAPGLEIAINDKVLHFFGFGILTLLIYFFLDCRVLLQNVIRTAIIAFILSLTSEFIQGLLPYKEFDGFDICANLLGSSTFLGISATIDYHLRSRQQHRSWTELNKILEEEPLEEV
ncbi:hypothetical protein K7432_009031 [Basidiobolus ranarum]|uniref:VanZ-like domain-containing protein n=1 Tax=Basidiobolus ranarum TaxID=34480 RepID=A0ABR2WQW2_9FUNG